MKGIPDVVFNFVINYFDKYITLMTQNYKLLFLELDCNSFEATSNIVNQRGAY